MPDNELILIKQKQWDDLLLIAKTQAETIKQQAIEIHDLQKLKADLIDENQAMSSKLRIKEHQSCVDVQDLIDCYKDDLDI